MSCPQRPDEAGKAPKPVSRKVRRAPTLSPRGMGAVAVLVTVAAAVVGPPVASALPVGSTHRPTGVGAPTSDGAGPQAPLLQRFEILRALSGCRPWVLDPSLERAAEISAGQLSGTDTLGHVDGDGGTAHDRARREGYRGNVVEVVAAGSLDPDAFMATLTRMVGQTDLLDCRFRSVGAALDHGRLVIILGDR